MSKVSAIVRTRSLRGGHYRAGRRHEAEPGDIPPGAITEEQLAILRADPDLEVETIDPPQEPPKAPTPPRKGKQAAPEAGAAKADAPAPDPAEAAEAAEADAGDEDFGFDDDPEAPDVKPEGK